MSNLASKPNETSFYAKQLVNALNFLKQSNNDKLATFSLIVVDGIARLWTSNRIATFETTFTASGTMPLVTMPLQHTLKLLRSCKQDYITFDGIAFYGNHMTLNIDTLEFHNAEINLEGKAFTEDTCYLDGKAIIPSLKNLIRASGVCENSVRNYGSVLYFDTDRIVGTDGFRLAFTYADLSQCNGFSLPFRTFKALTRLKNTIKMQVTECKSLVYITDGTHRILARTSSVKYPSYHAVMPKTSTDIRLPNFKDSLKSLLETANKSMAVNLLTHDHGTINIWTKDSSICIPFEGQGKLAMTVNGKFLLDAMRDSKEDTLYLQFKSSCNETPLIVGLMSHQTVIVPIRESKP